MEAVLGTVPHPRGGIKPFHVPAWMFLLVHLGLKGLSDLRSEKYFPPVTSSMDVIYVPDHLCNMGFSLLLRTAWEQEKIVWVRLGLMSHCL